VNSSYLKFKRPAKNCLLCGVNIEKAEQHASILNLSETEEALRKDICPKCWTQISKPEYFSFWVTKRYQEGPTSEERRLAKSERNQALWALFNVLYAQNSDELGPHLFLTAHLLMKYRVLQFARGEDGFLVFLHQQSNEEFKVPDIPLDSVSFVDIKEALESQMMDYVPEHSEEDHQQEEED